MSTQESKPEVTNIERVTQDVREPEHQGGMILASVEKGPESGLKLAADGHTVLLPQPSDDPKDPLNWSWMKKHSILTLLVVGAFSCDFTAAAQAAVVIQAKDWNMSPNTVTKASSLNVLMIGIGGVLWIPVSRFWDRGPVLFWSAVIGWAFILGASLSQDFNTYYTFRGLQSTFQSSYLTIGLEVITDIFFFHEHARKIGMWIAAVLTAPYVGPILSNLILYYVKEWRPVWWMILPVATLAMVLAAIIGDETYYDRKMPQEQQPKRGTRIARLLGIWQIRNHSYFDPVWDSVMILLRVMYKPLVVAAFFYYLCAYMWFVGTSITAPILLQIPREDGGYGFDNKGVALLSIAPLMGVSLGELFGHFFNDFLANRYIKRHEGIFVPEARLVANYLATVLMVPGLIVLGLVLKNHLHWSGIIFGWGMYTWGACVLSVALFAYLSDSYPTAAGEVSAFLNLARCAGGFSVGYFEQPWGLASGYDVSFGIQAAIVFSSCFFLVAFQFYGQRLRVWSGPV